MCTPRREVSDTRPFVGVGAPEFLSFGLSAGLLDAVVPACDGAGTVIVTKPALVQGIGGRMSGLVKTVPYNDVISRIEENGGIVIDKAHAVLDQMAGVAEAYKRGYKNVAVTVAIPAEAKKIRELYPDAMIFGVHVTGLDRAVAEMLVAARRPSHGLCIRSDPGACRQKSITAGRGCGVDLCGYEKGKGADHREDPAER
jgi:putative methanogenesis marker protein 8